MAVCGPARLGSPDRVGKPPAWGVRHTNVVVPGGPVFHGISRAEGPSQQATKGDGLSYGESSVSRTFCASCKGVKGLCRKAAPCCTPSFKITSCVCPDM